MYFAIFTLAMNITGVNVALTLLASSAGVNHAYVMGTGSCLRLTVRKIVEASV
jgi:hypothetical protein